MELQLTRRQMLKRTSLAVGGCGCASLAGVEPALAITQPSDESAKNAPFGFCFNTSTIRGQKLPIEEQIEIVAEAGYQGIEPWMGDLAKYHQQGKSLPDLKKRIADLGLSVESAIGFAPWIVDDDARRAEGLEQAKRDMALLRQIGGKRIAAPPVGATEQTDLDLFKAAERYRVLLELGDQMGVVPQVEVWGFSKTLSRLGETIFVAAESGHPKACLLPDVYHIYKGGSDFNGLKLLAGSAFHVFHINDYPADPPRGKIGDADRVYPGDGVAPLDSILKGLFDNGFRGMLSLELFNRDYWKQDPLMVAKNGLAKMQAAVRKSLAT